MAVMLAAPPTEERRRLPLATAWVSIRAAGDDGVERFHGYASVFNVRTAIGNPLKWGFYEQCAPGMFTKTLMEGDPRFLVDHDSYYVVSRASAGTLGLAQDKHGLAVDSALDPALYYVEALKANVLNKNITGMSFGFITIKDQWDTETVDTSDGNTAEVEIRTLLEVRLIEVSAVTFPAYEQTEAEVKSVATALVHRGDVSAIEQRAAYKPELLELCRIGREPGASTRVIDPAPNSPTDNDSGSSVTDPQGEIIEPAASTRLIPSINDRMRARAIRYRLPFA